jgi:hypothetical protein
MADAATAEATETNAAPSPAAPLLGFVDAIEGGRVFGWVWDREAPDARVEVIVHGGGRHLGTVLADLPREDLTSGGVGDGCHAFEFELPPGIEPVSVKVTARRPGGRGDIVSLRPRPASPDAPPPGLGLSVARLDETVQSMASSLRILHRTMQGVVAEVRRARAESDGTDAELLAELRETQHRLKQQMDGLELVITRLDGTLADQGAVLKLLKERKRDRALLGGIVVLGVLTLLSAAVNLAHVLS